MDELTQQNAALVEEATAASQAMAGQVRELNDMLARYDVGTAAAAAPAAERTPMAAAAAAVRTAPQPAEDDTRLQSRRAAGAGGEWIEA
jgi:hypothetical protein